MGGEVGEAVGSGKCTDPCRKTTFLLERAFWHFHVSLWEGGVGMGWSGDWVWWVGWGG